MATAAELGLTTPAGTDLIRNGDDAITNNANVLAALYTEQQEVNKDARRMVCEPLTLPGGSGVNNSTDVGVRIPFRVPVNCSRWRVFIRNYNDRLGRSYPGALSFTGVTIGRGATDYNGRPTGQFDGGKFPIANAFVSSETGSQWASPWQSYELEPSQEYVLSYGYKSAAQDNYASVGGGWLTTGGSAGINTDGVGLVKTKAIPLDVWIAFEVGADTKQNGYYGDSLTAGVSSDIPVYDSWAKKHAHAQGAFAQMYAYSGTGYVELDSDLRPGINKYVNFSGISKPDVMYNAMGSNDLTPSDVPQMLARMTTALGVIRKRVCSDIVHVTVLPRLNGSDIFETHRKAWNKYLIDNVPGNALYTLDAAQALEDPTGKVMESRWRASPTDIHMNTAGYARYAASVEGSTADLFRRKYTVNETAGRTVTIWDYLNQREQVIYGDTGERDISSLFTAGGAHGGFTLRRSGNTCTLTLYNWSPSAEGNGVVAVLPQGFRPKITYTAAAQGLSSRIQVTMSGNVQAYNWTTAAVVASLVWITDDPWPTSLPGVAA